MDTFAVRLPQDLVGRIDDYVGKTQADTRGADTRVTRASAIRELIVAGLEIVEQTGALALALPDELVEQIDDFVEQKQAQMPLKHMRVTRADVILHLLVAGLKAERKR